MTIEELKKSEDFDPYFNLKIVLVHEAGQLKIGYFEAYENVLGKQRPTVLRMVDRLSKTETTLKFKDAKKASLPDLLFEKQNLGRS